MISSIIFALQLSTTAAYSAAAAEAPPVSGSCEDGINPAFVTSLREYKRRLNEAEHFVGEQLRSAADPNETRLLREFADELSDWERVLNGFKLNNDENVQLPVELRSGINQTITIAKMLLERRKPVTLPYGNRARELNTFGSDWSQPPTSEEMGGRTYGP